MVAEEWAQTQAELARRRIPTDVLDFTPGVPPPPADDSSSSARAISNASHVEGRKEWEGLERIAGLDISFFEGTNEAVSCLVVLSYPDFKILYEDCRRVTLTHPYIATFLAFRESPPLLDLLTHLRNTRPELYPQIALIDGNGTLHPRQFGSACHIGVLADLPTIGVAKNFLEIREEGLLMREVKAAARNRLTGGKGAWFPLVGTKSGQVLGAALRASQDSVNPIFVSPGHRVSLQTAVALATACCRYRVPEPIRAADHASREVVRAVLKEQGVEAVGTVEDS
ncbi:hypothetical protein HK104_002353 [Borealophlyctis nickersoniae]|nr:hypothetical protein HK104_002353 [Borealophlyctis nickersoniae]